MVKRSCNIRAIVGGVASAGLALVTSAQGVEATVPADVSGDLRVVSNWTASEADAFAAVIDGFEERYPDVSVEIEQVPFGETQALLTQQFAQGQPPDVSVALPGIVRLFADQGLLVNLDDAWDGWLADGSYNESLREIASGPDGSAYAVYFKGNVNGLIWYTPAQLETLGVDVPGDWDTFIAAADAAVAGGTDAFAVGGKDGWPLTQWADPLLLSVAGPEAFLALQRGEIGWDDPRIVATFETYAELAEAYFPDDTLDTGFRDATCAWASGDAAFENQGAFISLIVPAECDESLVPGEDFTFVPMPKQDESLPDAQAVSGDLFIGAADSENPEATMALLTYLGSAEAQAIWAGLGGYIAPNANVPLEAYPTDIDRQAAELWPSGSDVTAAYDLDDWIGGEIQSEYVSALQQLVRDYDAEAFIATMTQVDTRSAG
jgi:alpha-glucoside transport system substrate-binding protein